jgi:hypothetical protein
MQLRSLGRATLGGWLYGALLFGGVLSLEHVLYNRLASVADSLITLAVFLLLYGAWGAAFFAAAWLLRKGWRLLPSRRAATANADSPAGESWGPGLALFNLVFWEVFFLYGLTYDQAPFGHPKTKWGMLGVLGVLALGVGLGVWIAVRLQAAVARRLLARRRLGPAALAFAILLAVLHPVAALVGWAGKPIKIPHRPAQGEAGQGATDASRPASRCSGGLDGDWRPWPMMGGDLPNFSRA